MLLDLPRCWQLTVGRSLTFLGSMLNFFRPMATCLFFCSVLLQTKINKQYI
uniref:Uncharacterized protein n=1 Tax=Anguilla anguilla TaxID=7936 RepID=A0A0E9PGE4_ANGAN